MFNETQIKYLNLSITINQLITFGESIRLLGKILAWRRIWPTFVECND